MARSNIAVAKHILTNIDNVRKLIRDVVRIREYLIGFCLEGHITEIEFYAISSLLSSQSRSPLWEKYYREKHGAVKVKATENAGDFKLNGKNYEYKVSLNEEDLLHMVQIRLWQGCDYIIQSIQTDKVYTFELLHEQMKQELKNIGATPAHGTTEANKSNTNVELRATLEVGGSDWDRWISHYLVESHEK